jgi:hypothetical protein
VDLREVLRGAGLSKANNRPTLQRYPDALPPAVPDDAKRLYARELVGTARIEKDGPDQPKSAVFDGN